MRWLVPRVAATSAIGAMDAVVMEAGCGPNPGTQCRKSSDCTGGAYCNLEPNVCFVRSDAICVTDAGVDAGTSPAVFNVTVSPSATACSGGRVTIGLDGSALGVTYQVMRESTPYGSPRAGTGAPLALAAATEPGVYTVVATATDTGCSSRMDGNVSITFSSLSAGTAAASSPEICAFSSTSLTLTGQTGANHWQWQVSAHGAEAWGDVPGATSATLSTGALAASMDYRAVVTSGACPLVRIVRRHAGQPRGEHPD